MVKKPKVLDGIYTRQMRQKTALNSHSNTKRKQKLNCAVSGTPWSQEEINELKEVFYNFFEKKARPKRDDIVEGLWRSKKNGGRIHLRKIESVRMKIYDMVVRSNACGQQKTSTVIELGITE